MQAVGIPGEAFHFSGDAAIFGERRVRVDISGRKERFRGLEFFLDRRLMAGDEFAYDNAVLKRTFALFAATFRDANFDGSKREVVGDVEVRETFSDRPVAGLRAPLELFAVQALRDRFGVAEIGVDLGNQHGDIGIERHFLIITKPDRRISAGYNIRFQCASLWRRSIPRLGIFRVT